VTTALKPIASNPHPVDHGVAIGHVQALAHALRRLVDAGISLDGASDHGVSEALYLRDPDGNGIELSWDPPEAAWPDTEDGRLIMDTRPLDIQELLCADV
jgi:catechol 2,3-dioxygenase